MHPTTPEPAPLRRRLLIALAAGWRLLPHLRAAHGPTGRGVACRLAAGLDDWAAAGWPTDRNTALALGVPEPALTAARNLLDALGSSEPSEAARAVDGALRRAEAAGDRIVTREDPGYPPALRDLDLPPPAVWLRGLRGLPELPPAERSVAIVGSRRADAYGKEAATLFARELAAAGVTVVSGFARGVDAAAHRGALDGWEGDDGLATVAVLGTGLGVDYPRGHRRLGEAVAERGVLVTELPPGAEPKAWHFPVRNRLIAALAAATLVVRAAPRSGSLVTARLALDLGRDVLAVPGRIFDDRSRGTNRLIVDGAHPALEPRDVLDLLGLPPVPEEVPDRAPEGETVEEGAGSPDEPARKGDLRSRLLATLVPGDPASPEALAGRLEAPLDRVLGALLELELAGKLRREPGPAYVRRA